MDAALDKVPDVVIFDPLCPFINRQPTAGPGDIGWLRGQFFDGHDNKLTADVSRVELSEETGASDQDARFRLQWDVSF